MAYHVIPYATGGNSGLGLSNAAIISHATRDIKRGEQYRLVFGLPVLYSQDMIHPGDIIRVNHVSFTVDAVDGDEHMTVVSVTIGDASPWVYVVYGVGALLGVGTALYLGGEAAEKVGEAAEKSEGAIVSLGVVMILSLLAWAYFRGRP